MFVVPEAGWEYGMWLLRHEIHGANPRSWNSRRMPNRGNVTYIQLYSCNFNI